MTRAKWKEHPNSPILSAGTKLMLVCIGLGSIAIAAGILWWVL